MNRPPRGIVLAAAFLLAATAPVRAALPGPAERPAVVGDPVALAVGPAAVTLTGPRARLQLVVTGRYADGAVRDLSGLCDLACDDGLVAVGPGGFLAPRKNGVSQLVVRAGRQTARVPLTVRDFDRPQPVSFRHEVVAALNVSGCNAGACHGTPSGKNGFRLSLRGFDPDADFLQLTRDSLGRRTDRHHPDDSLLLLKGLGRLPHEGGQRFVPGGLPAAAVRDWLAEGLRDDSSALPAVQGIDVLPGSRVQLSPARWQQLSVQARFADGSARDVTRLTVFSSSDPAVADVSPSGLVEFRQAGEVAILCRYLMELNTVRLTYLEPRKDFVWGNPPESNYVDHHVFAKLKLLNLQPSELCSDADFVRRATLDLCGVLPTADEVRAFLGASEPDKRARLVDALLARPEYADYWTLKWSDIFRSSRKNIQLKGTYVFQHWLHDHLARDTGYDAVVRELLTASGGTFANPPANYYRIARDPQNLAETTAQLFLGVRMQCAKCHNHPFERWSQDDYYSLSAFFARVRQRKDPREPGPKPEVTGGEVIFSERGGEVTQPRTGRVMPPKFPGGPLAVVAPGKDRRVALAAWVTAPDNPFFARSTVNRIWYHLLGRGVVDPVDDFRDSNPSANDELLDAMARDFASNHFSFKHLIRVIMNSRTYQLGAAANETNKDDTRYFSHAVTRLLPAEPLLDALCTALEVPEKFAGVPAGTRATQLPDGEFNHPFLKTFGQPARELACECERESDSNLAQALQLINGPTVNEKLRSPNNRVGRLLGRKAADSEVLQELYLATLSRPPSPDDLRVSLDYVHKAADRRKAWEDVHWALINSKEFLFRH